MIKQNHIIQLSKIKTLAQRKDRFIPPIMNNKLILRMKSMALRFPKAFLQEHHQAFDHQNFQMIKREKGEIVREREREFREIRSLIWFCLK